MSDLPKFEEDQIVFRLDFPESRYEICSVDRDGTLMLLDADGEFAGWYKQSEVGLVIPKQENSMTEPTVDIVAEMRKVDIFLDSLMPDGFLSEDWLKVVLLLRTLRAEVERLQAKDFMASDLIRDLTDELSYRTSEEQGHGGVIDILFERADNFDYTLDNPQTGEQT